MADGSPRARILLAVLLAAATVLAYLPVLTAGFVGFDDPQYLFDNPYVRDGWRWEHVGWAFTHEHQSNWHPLTWLSHMLDVELFGRSAAAHHAVNLALHAANAVLLFALLASLTGQLGPSVAVAALFALHPVQVESVAWVSQRKTLLATCFALLSLHGYARHARTGSRRAYAASLACFALSLMSKQLFVTLPFALLLLDYWPLRRRALEPPAGGRPTWRSLARGGWQLLPEKLPFLLLTALASGVALLVQQASMASFEWLPPAARAGNAVIAYARYLGHFLWPVDLSVFYPLHVAEITGAAVLSAGALLLAISAACLLGGRRHRALPVGWLWFLGTLVPMIGLVQVGAQALADRYLYVPSWGLAIALVWPASDALERARSGTPRRAAVAGLALVLLACATATFRRAGVWRDTLTLFEDALAHTEGNWLAHRTLAAESFAAGDLPGALRHCEAALPYGRDLGVLYGTCGLALYELGRVDEALAHLEEGLRAAPHDPIARTNLGWVLSERGELARAERLFAEAEALFDRHTTAYARRTVHANRARVLARLGREPEAREQIARALAIDPDLPLALRQAAEVELLLGDRAAAEAHLRRALAIAPDDAATAALLAALRD